MYDNEQYATLNNAIPTVDDLASYLFAFVALQPEQLTLAKSVSKRRNHEYVLDKLNELFTESILTYSQTLELVTIGFRALDPSIFHDINNNSTFLETLTGIIHRDDAYELGRLLFNENTLTLRHHLRNWFDLRHHLRNYFDKSKLSQLLWMASERGSFRVVEKLVMLGDRIDVNWSMTSDNMLSRSVDIYTPLEMAMRGWGRGHRRIVEILLKVKEINVNFKDNNGTPILFLPFYHWPEAFKMLLGHPVFSWVSQKSMSI
jgi:hypothetical protein